MSRIPSLPIVAPSLTKTQALQMIGKLVPIGDQVYFFVSASWDKALHEGAAVVQLDPNHHRLTRGWVDAHGHRHITAVEPATADLGEGWLDGAYSPLG